MSPAELEAARRLLFMSPPEAAASISHTSEQAWRRWEAGTRSVPADVAGAVTALLNWRRQAIQTAREIITNQQGAVPAVVWYDDPDLFGGNVAQWRAHQSVCAALHVEQGARLITFDQPAYSTWLTRQGRADSELMRGQWAASQSV
jgi:hypothetical protein